MHKQNNTILIIGGPNAGKTHFGGQLFGRLNARTEHYKITSLPDDISIFQEVLDNLNDGKSSGHTNVSSHNRLKLEIESTSGQRSEFSFPDYGGEQIKTIINSRRVNKTWAEQIERSNSWMLFIRADELQILEDVVNRGLPEQEILKKRTEKKDKMLLSNTAFYIELLQIFLYIKKVGIKQMISSPKLVVALSCWDKLSSLDQEKLPEKVFEEKLPGLLSFIRETWKSDTFKIIGLSSVGKDLSNKKSDPEFIKKGPENFGYIITPEGRKEIDLTLTISYFID
ncbi:MULTISPECIES: hypothetical protein [Sphingobacterium]|uniref:TRAFAC clade GTPase domain-containing protein n=1 Tax=Sphingobacterium TaxID=28453 RepID=UPI00257D6181|nr:MULTISPECIES: hypothetical protein [Sphingobacterium]